MEKKEPTMRMILKFLLDNTMKEISLPAIPISIVYDNEKPVEIPINLKITISIKVDQS